MPAYYNEIDPYAAEWLRNLILNGVIADGDVDERSIVDVPPDDLRGYEQCHFFAGIGGWSVALRLAGWPDDRPVWTGSCPCQPFSTAGRGAGFADERHLWPYWHYLIEECRPPVVFGEQVEAAIRLGWLDLVQADMEGLGYAFGAAGLPAACVGAPHIRQRLWFVADATGSRQAQGAAPRSEAAGEGHGLGDCGALADGGGTRLEGRDERSLGRQRQAVERSGGAGALANDDGDRREEQRLAGLRRAAVHDADGRGEVGGALVNADGGECGGRPRGAQETGRVVCEPEPGSAGAHHWRDLVWLPCRDGKARPTQPGLFPLVDGVRDGRMALGSAVQQPLTAEQAAHRFNRVGTLRGAGNAIVPAVAAEFIEAYMRCLP